MRAWLCALLRRDPTQPSPSLSLPHSEADAWSEEAFYGMADQLYGHDAPRAS